MSSVTTDWLRDLATWPAFAAALVAAAACWGAFRWRRSKLGAQHTLLDSRFWYKPKEVQELFDTLGEPGRKLYAVTQVTVDLVFPLAYGLLFAMAIVRLYGTPAASWLLFLPLLTVVFDLAENVLTAYLAWPPRHKGPAIVRLAATCTATKFTFFALSSVATVIGLVIAAVEAVAR